MSNSDIEQSGTVKGHLPNEASLSGRISNGLSLSGHISIGRVASDFIIKMTVEGDGDYNYTVTSCDATIEQIDAAVAAEKRVVLIASVDGSIVDGSILELPMLQGIEGNAYYFGAFSGSQIITSFVEKIENTSNWEFDMNQIQSEDVGYSNPALPNGITNVKMALDELVPKSHSHDNKSVLDKLSETDGKLQYNGEALGGGANDFVIKMTVEANGEYYTVTSCDATVEQIDAAVAAEKKVVLIATQINSSLLWEMPIVQGSKGNFYYFGTFLQGKAIAAFVLKDGDESGWLFVINQIKALDVDYSNNAIPNISTVEEALNVLVPKSHSHDNKSILDKLSVSNGKLQYNGSDVGLKGDTGAAGADGITPHIGDNGNWYLGTTDTGKPSRGEKGEPGEGGGSTYYVELNGNYPNYTLSETTSLADIAAAYNGGKTLLCRYSRYGKTATLPLFGAVPESNLWIFSGSGGIAYMDIPAQYSSIMVSNIGVIAENKMLSQQLKITVGNTEYLYDGNEAVNVDMDGITPTIGANGNWYLGTTDTGKPSRGEKGDTGAAGADGYTPVKGTDYWTESDKAEIVNDTLAALPTWTGGNY